MKKAKKLTKPPKRRAPVPQTDRDGTGFTAVPEGPDLSYITPGLRPLATRCSDLDFHPHNPHKHSEEHIAKIAAILKERGQNQNIIASTRTGRPVVVIGNGRLRATLSLGREWIACEAKMMTEAEEKEHLLIDNLIGADPEYDLDNLWLSLDGLTLDVPELAEMLNELQEELVIPPLPSDKEHEAEKTKCPSCGHEF